MFCTLSKGKKHRKNTFFSQHIQLIYRHLNLTIKKKQLYIKKKHCSMVFFWYFCNVNYVPEYGLRVLSVPGIN